MTSLAFSVFAARAELAAHDASMDADFAPTKAVAQESRDRAERERAIARHARLLERIEQIVTRQDSALRDYGVLSQAELNAENRVKAEVLRLLREEK